MDDKKYIRAACHQIYALGTYKGWWDDNTSFPTLDYSGSDIIKFCRFGVKSYQDELNNLGKFILDGKILEVIRKELPTLIGYKIYFYDEYHATKIISTTISKEYII